MSGNARCALGGADIGNAFVRIVLAALLVAHAGAQLVAFWQASQIINPKGFPDAVMILNAAVPNVMLLAAIALALGFKTRAMALALMLLIASASVVGLLLFGAAGGALDWLPRLGIMIGLLVPFVTGGGRLSIDGLMEARFTPHMAE
jgi:uncharacterized membrane protein YphA (DoxX/SURF4 family)